MGKFDQTKAIVDWQHIFNMLNDFLRGAAEFTPFFVLPSQ